jgi:hypothetical protein
MTYDFHPFSSTWMVMNELHPLWMKHECLWMKFIRDYVGNDANSIHDTNIRYSQVAPKEK